MRNLNCHGVCLFDTKRRFEHDSCALKCYQMTQRRTKKEKKMVISGSIYSQEMLMDQLGEDHLENFHMLFTLITFLGMCIH